MITAADLRQRIDALPRQRIALLPTPLEDVPQLAAAVGVSELALKRDDLTGLVFGGNKIRELDFILGEAVASGCDTFIAGGGVIHSNHARQCSAAAIRAGLKPIMVLRGGGFGAPDTGNLLMTRALGAEIVVVDDDPGLNDRDAMAGAMDRVAERERASGRRPYVLHSSFHPLAAVSYVECGLELAAQMGNTPATIFVASMGATVVGLQLAAVWLGLDWTFRAVTWRPETPNLRVRLAELAEQTAARLGLASSLTEDDFHLVEAGGPAYGVQSAASSAALRQALRSAAVVLDPVYSAKGMAGLIAEAAAGRVPAGRRVVFVHTGGLPALFTYADEILAGAA
jgi:1-aminocyclopropane-1-carboxylate deaminase/D-cysteine desulfhydrase-like pyridoxal-dependent ACC family enzyme